LLCKPFIGNPARIDYTITKREKKEKRKKGNTKNKKNMIIKDNMIQQNKYYVL